MQKVNCQLCFYSDAPEWGGQEILAARIANSLVDSFVKILFFYSCDSFQNALDSKIQAIRLPFAASTPFPIFRDLSLRKRKTVQNLFQKNHVENLVVCPGNIERCLPAIFAANRLGIFVVSYCPMAYTQRESGAAFGAIRDLLAKTVYPKISEWIVISKTQERLIRRFIAKEVPVHRLSNPLNTTESGAPKIPGSPLRIATVGRIYFPQKGQDLIPKVAKILKEKNFPCAFHIIGDGPDKDKLNALIKKNRVEDFVRISKWMPPQILHQRMKSEFDILLLPSHFEGDPLVIFEAMACGLPVLIANEKYAEEFALPDWMTFTPGNLSAAVFKIQHFSKNYDEAVFTETRNRLTKEREPEAFWQNTHRIFSKIFAQDAHE